MAKKKTNYWLCVIGSADEKDLKKVNGADAVLRMPVKRAFDELTDGGSSFKYCSSGFGMSERKADLVLQCWNMDENELSDMIELHKVRKIMK